MIVGQQLGPFAVEKEIGSGAMGTVYLARYTRTGQPVAIKMLAPGLGSNETSLARFEQEAAILKRLHHANVVRFFGVGRFQGTPFYAMEYIQGESLDHMMERRGRIGWEQVVSWGKQLCSALQHVHELGIIHRDLKPSNLIVLPDDTLKLSDFGIARDLDMAGLTSTNTTVGTAAYMSPEQCRGERHLTHKADLYCLGVVLYELLTGTKPFHAETTMGMLMQHVRGKFERPARIVLEIPPWLDTLVCQLLEKKPEHRPRDAAIIAEALDHGLEKMTAEVAVTADVSPGTATLDGSSSDLTGMIANKDGMRSKKGRKKRQRPIHERGWFVSCAVAGLLLAAGIGFYFLFLKVASPEKLHLEAQHLMASPRAEDRELAREHQIQTFLDHYPDHQLAPQMQTWADEVDRAVRERQLATRFTHGLISDDAERTAHAAVQHENDGNLEAARKLWQKLETHNKEKDLDQRAWSLVAAKRLQALEMAREREKRLRKLMDDAMKTRKKALSLDKDWVRPVEDAAQCELSGDRAKALGRWEEVKLAYQKSDQRSWYLLATLKVKELSGKPTQVSNEHGTNTHPQP